MQTILKNKNQKMTKMPKMTLLSLLKLFESNMHEAADFHNRKLGRKQA